MELERRIVAAAIAVGTAGAVVLACSDDASDANTASAPACTFGRCDTFCSTTLATATTTKKKYCDAAAARNIDCAVFCPGVKGATLCNAAEAVETCAAADDSPVQLLCSAIESRDVGTLPSDCTQAIDGRRPADVDFPSVGPGSALGVYLGNAAAMEAVSVEAFLLLADELVLHGADSSLAEACRIAAEEERGHEQRMRALSEAHGVHVGPSRSVPAVTTRSFFAMALENAVEGMVRETYSAAEITYRSRHAVNEELRGAFEGIARDEVSHASLSARIGAMCFARLSSDERHRIAGSMREAIDDLRRERSLPIALEVHRRAGVPTPAVARALMHELERTVWAPWLVRLERGDALAA